MSKYVNPDYMWATVLWIVVAGVALGAVLLLVHGSLYLAHYVSDRNAQLECESSSRIVQFYDEKHTDLWKCIKPSPEKAP